MNLSHMTKTLLSTTALAGLLLTSACGKDEAPAAGGAPSGAEEAPVATFAAVEATIEDKRGGPTTVVKLELPSGFQQHDFFKDVWVPSLDGDPMKVGVRFERGCNGTCDSAKIPENIAKAKQEAVDGVSNPNFKMIGGSPEENAHFKGTAEVLADKTLDNGAVLHVYRATYPKPPADKARPNGGLFVRCFLHNEGDTHYTLIDGRADAKSEGKIWPALEKACASATYEVKAPAAE